jgi:protein transport protein SEC13
MSSFSIDTQHDDMIHDSQFDYYSKRMATCSSDRTIKIFDITGNIHHNSATLTGHDGPVWQVAWAHPKFGVILASCSYDGTVIIHREATQNIWSKVYEHKFHESSVNSISWAPHEFGLILACASSDGKVSILEYKDESWVCTSIQNDTLGCNSVTWGPYSALGSLSEDGTSTQRLATGSCDNLVRMYRLQDGKWEEEAKESNPHIDWVRDVAWAPNTGMPYNIIASCSEDRTVYIWKQTEANGVWTPTLLHSFDAPVWRLSWSITGNVLAVSTGDHMVTLWKQSVDETWVQITSVDDSTNTM